MAVNPNYKQLLDSLTTAVVLVDNNFNAIHLNSAAEALLQVSVDQVFGTPLNHYFHEINEVADSLKSVVSKSYQYTKRKVKWRLHTGKQITVDYAVTPLPDSEHSVLEIQPLDRLLRISREEAIISSQETTRSLVRGMAHEVKNPLGGIRGAAQLLERELEDGALSEYTTIIIAEADRLRNLVDRILGPSQPMSFKPVNIHEVLERVALLINVESDSNVTITRDYDPSIPDIPGDQELLVQAVLNIVRNAVQALQESNTPAGTISLSTRIQRQFTIGRQHHTLVCEAAITDNGPGIPKPLVDNIFYPMISGRADGTGLGLAISQQLVNQHNGLIECNSQPGNTRFSIYIPIET